MTCDIWDTDYGNWELEFMTIFVTWQLRVTLDSIRNSCDVYYTIISVLYSLVEIAVNKSFHIPVSCPQNREELTLASFCFFLLLCLPVVSILQFTHFSRNLNFKGKVVPKFAGKIYLLWQENTKFDLRICIYKIIMYTRFLVCYFMEGGFKTQQCLSLLVD